MAKKRRPTFDPSPFSPKSAREEPYPNIARIKLSSRRASPADAVFYIQKGKVKVTVFLPRKEAVVQFLDRGVLR